MNKIVLLLLAILCAAATSAQHSIRLQIKNAATGEPLAGASVIIVSTDKAGSADTTGHISFSNLQAGKYTFRFSYVGLATKEESITLPYEGQQPFQISLAAEEEEEEEEVIIQSTRSSRTIRDIPTRVEFIAGEELDEKANMKPGDIRMVLTESTGIQTQQTSATSANASIRIQGLDGRYTQVLKDGFPLYAGFSSGLGLLQTPPLDLQQFEVIKGSASTLYGGGAIAGLVNLVSKTPQDERELKFHFDVTSAGGLNTSGFYGKRFRKTGITVFASRNSNAAYDPSATGLTAIPKFERYTLNPKLFIYFTPKTELSVGLNLATETRTGGDVDFIKEKKPSGFYERNETDRVNSQLKFEHHFGKCSHITFKNSLGKFVRSISSPSYLFSGDQYATFTEFTYASHGERSEWVTGLTLVTDEFLERRQMPAPARDYSQLTVGAFVQNNWKVSERFHLETGLRGDHVRDYGFAFLPRVSALFKFSPVLSSRIGGGLGYKTPTIFTEESERLQYLNVLPVDENVNELERSYGVNADVNYKTKFADGEVSFSINHLFFYTRINDPLLLQPDGSNYRFNTISGHIDSKGMETNIKMGYKDFKLFLGYTFTKAYLHEGNTKTENFLTPRHRINSVLLYEVEEKWKVGLEAYYFSRQRLSDGATGRSYWITGFMVEKLWEKVSLYVNFENFLDARQTKFDSIYTGTIANPVFRDIYAPLDGFVVNGGIKLRF
jgi:outer membrane receptor for ferrienterochelin and colicins